MAEPERDRWGRYKLPHPVTGEARGWTRVTKLAEALDDNYGLTQWQLRNVVYGMGKREDLHDLAAASDIEDVQQLKNIVKQATAAAKADARANSGTALHKFTERIDLGENIRAPARWYADLEAYKLALKEWGILTAPSLCERITIVPELECAGTMDKIVKYQNVPTIADLKTGGSVEKGLKYGALKMAIQLAIYSRGSGLWDMENSRWQPMPKGLDQSRGIIIHLPAGEATATLYEVDLSAGWEAALRAYQVTQDRKKKDYLVQAGEVIKVEAEDVT
jgi:hypothetical protein